MSRYILIIHFPNQHGYPISLTLEMPTARSSHDTQWGFVLNSLKTEQAQRDYVNELSELTGWQIEDQTK